MRSRPLSPFFLPTSSGPPIGARKFHPPGTAWPRGGRGSRQPWSGFRIAPRQLGAVRPGRPSAAWQPLPDPKKLARCTRHVCRANPLTPPDPRFCSPLSSGFRIAVGKRGPPPDRLADPCREFLEPAPTDRHRDLGRADGGRSEPRLARGQIFPTRIGRLSLPGHFYRRRQVHAAGDGERFPVRIGVRGQKGEPFPGEIGVQGQKGEPFPGGIGASGEAGELFPAPIRGAGEVG